MSDTSAQSMFNNDTNTNTNANKYKYRIGAWNINGIITKQYPENYLFKYNTIKALDFDVIFLSETFCLRDETFSISGYKVIQFNRQSVSHRSVRGSAGIAIAISNKLLSNHVVDAIYRGRQDGILAIKLRCSDNDLVIGLLANYLPPDSFHYGKDPESFLFRQLFSLFRPIRL